MPRLSRELSNAAKEHADAFSLVGCYDDALEKLATGTVMTDDKVNFPFLQAMLVVAGQYPQALTVV